MQAILGVFFHFIGGFASGSFYVPFKKVRGWSWESYWIIGGLFSWLIVPPLAAYLTVPGFAEIIRETDAATTGWTYFWGILWGIGGLTYGLGIRYLGMSLGNSVLLGLTAAFGSLIPSIYYNYVPHEGKITFSDMISNPGGQLVLLGVVVCLIGIGICGYAGSLKEKNMSTDQKQQNISEFNLSKGLTFAIISGILSACFNYGIEAGKPMADGAVAKGFNPLFQNNVIYIILLWGGLTTNFIWCVILNIRNRSYTDYTNEKTPLQKTTCFLLWRALPGSFSFFFMVWAKVNWVMGQLHGYCTWRLLYS